MGSQFQERQRGKFSQNLVRKPSHSLSSWILGVRVQTGHWGTAGLCSTILESQLENSEAGGWKHLDAYSLRFWGPMPVAMWGLGASPHRPVWLKLGFLTAWWLDPRNGGGEDWRSHIASYDHALESRGVTSTTFSLLRWSQTPRESREGEHRASWCVSARALEEQTGPIVALAIVRWRNKRRLWPKNSFNSSWQPEGPRGAKSTGSGAQVPGFRSGLYHLVA